MSIELPSVPRYANAMDAPVARRDDHGSRPIDVEERRAVVGLVSRIGLATGLESIVASGGHASGADGQGGSQHR